MIEGAATLLQNARRVIILAGAGMSSELGVPTYWSGPDAQYGGSKAADGYTVLQHAMAPMWLYKPELQRIYLREQQQQLAAINPNATNSPYRLLLNYLTNRKLPHFVVTSNIDGFFTRAGFDEMNLYEVHGTYRFAQCLNRPNQHGIFPATEACPVCNKATRPNVLFFNDYWLNPSHVQTQANRYDNFIAGASSTETVALEIGAGTTVPTIRRMSANLIRQGIPLLRINPQLDYELEPDVTYIEDTIGDALQKLMPFHV